MNRWTIVLAALAVCLAVVMGCSSGGVNPVAPTANPEITTGSSHTGQTQTHLWGYYDFYIDTQAETAEVVVNRTAMFSANVVSFLNNNPAGVGVSNLETIPGDGYMDVNLDISLTHPLNLEQYKGYDVRGIFIGNGSDSLNYDGDLDYAVDGTDQILYNADGYTRWWNPAEFQLSGVLGYTQGAIATNGYTGTATLNPYKYFADGLTPGDDVWEFLTDPGYEDAGVFSHGTANSRDYELRFPVPSPNVVFGYAVVANWQGEDLVNDHPSNAVEALAISAVVTPDIYYVDAGDNGGDLIMDLSVFDWGSTVSAGVMEDYNVYVESEVFTSNYMFDSMDLTAIGGSAAYSTYHVEIPTDNVTYNSIEAGHDSEFWVIVEYPLSNYVGEFTPDIPGAAPDAELAAFFRTPLFISDTPYNADPVCDIELVTTEFEGWGEVPVTVDATGCYDPDPLDTITFAWDFDGDGTYGDAYDSGTDDMPTFIYDYEYSGTIGLMLTDGVGGESTCETATFDITSKSCDSPACPSTQPTTMIGSNRLYNWDPQPVQSANTRVIAPYSSAYYMCTINVTGTSVYDLYTNNPSYSIYDSAIDSNDVLYYYDSGSSTTIWTATYTGSGFTGIRTSFSTIPSGNYILKVSMDSDDNPVVLARTSTGTPVVFHWDGSDWGSPISLPSSLSSEYGSYSYINDFEYDSSTGYYIIAEYYNSLGLHAFDADGTLVWQDTDIWSISGSSYQIGVFIDYFDPECHMIAMAGMNSTGQTTYWARYNPVGGDKTTGTTSGGSYGTTFSTFFGRGCVQVNAGTAYFLASTYGGNVWSSTTVPDW